MQMDRRYYVYEKQMSAGPCLPLPRGYIDHNIQTSSLKPLCQIQTLCGALLGRGNKKLSKWSWSPDQDGQHG